MEWLNDTLVEAITALIGSIYIVLRLVVAATPTNKDNEVLSKTHGVLKKSVVVLAKIAGLDVKQGIVAAKPKKKATIVK